MAPRILDAAVPICADVLNPFTHSISLTTYDKIRIGFMTVFIFPFRLLLMFLSILGAWSLSVIGTYGLSEKDLHTRPIVGWRRKLKVMELLACRVGFWAMGFLYFRVRGQKVSRSEAPIVVAAPHSSFFDTLLEFASSLHCPVVREQNRYTPLLSTMINFTQPMYVKREDPQSRQRTIQEIKRRSRSSEPWEQLLIFPEGTCTNHTCLIPFKLGAFHPGLPIQPVIVTYPNLHLDSLTWTWHGPSAFKQLWLTMTQFSIYSEIEFLPVYTPNDEEKKDPRLFAENVRKVMANKLRLPLSYFSFDDIQHICYAGQHNLPQTAPLIKLLKLQNKKGLDVSSVQKEIDRVLTWLSSSPGKIYFTRQDMTTLLHLPSSEALRDFFDTMDQDDSGKIDIRTYVCGLWLINLNIPMVQRVEECFKLLSVIPQKGCLDEEGFNAIVWIVLGFPSGLSSDIFYQLNGEKHYVSFATFKGCLSETERFKYLLETQALPPQPPSSHKNGFILNESLPSSKRE